MINVDDFAERVFGILRGHGFRLKLYDAYGNEIIDPKEARRFFVLDNSMMVTIEEDEEELQISKSNKDTLQSTSKVLSALKKLANEFLIDYVVRNFGKSIQPRDFSYKAKIKRKNDMKNNTVSEGLSRLHGGKQTSRQTLEDVKILVKHKKPIDEEKRGARSRNIQSIFLEMHGERFRFPHNHLGGARAMARHMSRGGDIHDNIGNYIIENTGRLIKLSEFVRYARSNKLINEETNDIISTIKENINTIKTDLKRLTGAKTYESIKTRIENSENNELVEDDFSNLKDLFTVKRFNEKFDDILPIVSTMLKEKEETLRKIEEASTKEIRYIQKDMLTDSMIEFTSPSAKFGHKLSNIANNLIENEQLSSFLINVSAKLCNEGEELTAFEQEIVSNTLNNLRPISETQITNADENNLKESIEYEKFFDKYLYTFI